MNIKTIKYIAFLFSFLAVLLSGCKSEKPIDWGDYNVLKQKPDRPSLPSYNGKTIPESEYLKWVEWGEKFFREETFGNEKVWTDVVGLMNGSIEVPDNNGYSKEPALKYFLQAIDYLDSTRGNLYTGNGGGYTNDLVVTFPKGSLLDETFPIPEKLHTGLDIEEGSPWPIGVVPKKVSTEEENLPYLINPAAFATGSEGIGSLPGGGKFRLGVTCALCHYSLDIDWDGKPDIKSAKPGSDSLYSTYKPQDAWAIGNQDIHLGWIFAFSSNNIAGFENTGAAGKSTQTDAREIAKWVLANYKHNPKAVKLEVDRGLLMFPRGFADDTPDGLHNPLQFPSLFTHMNYPYNYDGVMLNASDRNNNVWTAGLDLTLFVGLCKDRAGRTSEIAFWEEKGLYSQITAEQYADIIVANSPAVLHDPSQREVLKNDILGTSDGIPGMLDKNSVVLIKGIPGVVPKKIYDFPDNKKFNRIKDPSDFGYDGEYRNIVVALLGTRVITPSQIRNYYKINDLEKTYGMNGDEFVTDAVSIMLDWVEPPANKTKLLENAKNDGLVEKGYEIFKSEKCVDCHAGPYLTDNLIYPLKEIGTNETRAKATKLLQLIAPRYDPKTGKAVSGGVVSFISNIFSGKKEGYKSVTLRYLWGSAPYLHDGGVAITLKSDAAPAEEDLKTLLSRPQKDKIYGIGQITVEREKHPETYLRSNAALSLQAVVLKDEREKVIDANNEFIYPIPGRSDHIPISKMQIQGIGHEFWIEDKPGGDIVTALVAFLLALDDDPGN